MPRRKAPRQQAPTSIEEATALLGRYAGILTAAEQLRADADAAIAAIEAARDQALAPIDEEAKSIFLQLRAWWAVAGDALTEGRRKSVDLAGCAIGVRTTPPSLKIPGNAEQAGTLLTMEGLAHLCRIKAEPDKPFILALFKHGDATAELLERLRRLGFRPTQKEEFFIDRTGKAPADPEPVALQEAAE